MRIGSRPPRVLEVLSTATFMLALLLRRRPLSFHASRARPRPLSAMPTEVVTCSAGAIRDGSDGKLTVG